MITIVDYGMGNLRSVQKAFEKVGSAAAVTSDPDAVARAEKLVLPGVGAIADAMAHLREGGLIPPIQDYLRSQRPFLGICLGLQMLFEKSYEGGDHACLGHFAGDVARFELDDPKLKVPHMGWNYLEVARRPPIFDGLPERPCVYFVHSYYVRPTDPEIIATRTDYGVSFTSMVWRDNVFATQFHPEKSQQVGLTILKNFAAI